MKDLDRLLQRWRIRVALPWILPGRLLDVGCADGALGNAAGGSTDYVGVDPEAPSSASRAGFSLVRGAFPEAVAARGPFDSIAMLAVLEHVPLATQPAVARACHALLRPGGVLVITVPSPAVDRIIDALKAVKVLDGMDTGHHYGFAPELTVDLFTAAGFELSAHRRFQLGLNNLFVFRRS